MTPESDSFPTVQQTSEAFPTPVPQPPALQPRKDIPIVEHPPADRRCCQCAGYIKFIGTPTTLRIFSLQHEDSEPIDFANGRLEQEGCLRELKKSDALND